ncbi:hypothetical protein GCM10023176_62220 [Micromonospora coerulea]|uniref:Uncharacterized protein n=1 Tax=Micromonospora coerulea TaxID=47856 RepID=A0ABP8T862_9ACTN
MLVLFSTLAFGPGFGDPAGDHGRVGAGFECRSVAGQFRVALGDGGSFRYDRVDGWHGSVAAQIVAGRWGGTGRPLAELAGPIHHPG